MASEGHGSVEVWECGLVRDIGECGSVGCGSVGVGECG